MRHVLYFIVGVLVVSVGGVLLVAGPSFILERILPDAVFFFGAGCKEYSRQTGECVSYLSYPEDIWLLRIAWTFFFYAGSLIAFLLGFTAYDIGRRLLNSSPNSNPDSDQGEEK